jgi:hypothetical protein
MYSYFYPYPSTHVTTYDTTNSDIFCPSAYPSSDHSAHDTTYNTPNWDISYPSAYSTSDDFAFFVT